MLVLEPHPEACYPQLALQQKLLLVSGVVSEYVCGWLIPNMDLEIELREVLRCDNVHCCHLKHNFIENIGSQSANDYADGSN